MVIRSERGSCFCGAIVATMAGEPFWINYDHDDDCRKALGSPLTVWVGYQREQVTFVSGVPKTFSRTPGVERSFCPNCGTSIGYADQGLAGELWLSIGFFDNPERFEPQAHAFWRMKLPWLDFADKLPRHDAYTQERNPELGNPADRKSK